MDTQPTEAFVDQVQEVLRRLYSPVELRQTSMIAFLGLERRPNPALALQELIINAIEQLRPRDYAPPQADSWRIFQVLTYRHVEQSSQPAVAATLALSVRQLRRLERMAEQALAGYLWKRYHLADKVTALNAEAARRIRPNAPAEETPDLDEELAWLRESFPSESGDLASVINGIGETVRPLTDECDVEFETEIAEDIPPVSGQLVALRQGLLNLITAAMHTVSSGAIHLWAGRDGTDIEIRVQAEGEAGVPWTMDSRVVDHLQMARRFTGLFGGSLDVAPVPLSGEGTPNAQAPFSAKMRLPVDEAVPVLVIDDNADTLRLIQRYLTGTRYRFLGARTPEEALDLAAEHAPEAIVMDVMLPGIDDWELLGRLRAHPDLYDVPIIVCTILPQEELALALGAAAYLRKPVSREALRAVLDQQVAPPLKAPA